MKLQSARDLKDELIRSLLTPASFAAPRTAAAGAPLVLGASKSASARIAGASGAPLAMSAKAITEVPKLPRTVALGVSASKKSNDFVLAVRVQREMLLESPLMQRIRARSKYEVDIRLIGRVSKRRANSVRQRCLLGEQRPLLAGCSIGHFRVTAGTLGAFVRDADGRIHILSNNHVLANKDRATKGDAILQPGKLDGGITSRDRSGRLHRWIRINKSSPNLVDCALATIDDGIEFDTRLFGTSKRLAIRCAGIANDDVLDEGLDVRKIGRTTCITRGRVTAFELDNVIINFDEGNRRFDNQIEVEGAGRSSFCDGGDSGSLVYTENNLAVGLLFAGSDSGGTNGRGLTYINPISVVLDKLRVSLFT